jgi:nicotinic acid mononucleotide adenylyltransferase
VATEHFGHRVAMLNRAVRPHPKLGVLEMVEATFSVKRSLPKLRRLFPNAQLVLLVGSDVVPVMVDWPDIDRMFAETELVVGMRGYDQVKTVANRIARWPFAPQKLHLCETYGAGISSGAVRAALRGRSHVPGLLKSVANYSRRNWLYITIS